MNIVLEIGRLTRDVELRYTSQSQTAVGTFTLAVDRRKKEDGADFIRCKAWGKTAEILEKYVKQGRQIAIKGRLETGSYKNKDGVTIWTTHVIVEDFKFLDSSREHAQKNQQPASQPVPQNPAPQPAPQEHAPVEEQEAMDGFYYTDDNLPY